jgi:hypothetical protein
VSVPLHSYALPGPLLRPRPHPVARLLSLCSLLSACATAGAASPFAAVRGTYCGLFAVATNGVAPSAGGFTFTTTASGSLSGVWQMGGERFKVSGRFDTAGNFSTTISPPHLTPVTVTLKLDLAAGTPQVTGSVSRGQWTAELIGERAVFDGHHYSAPEAGRYTMMIPGDCTSSNAPCGDSYGTLSVNTRGSVRLSGVLADGTRFTQAAAVSASGQWPLYAPLYGRQGWLWGWLTFTNPPAGELGGNLSWVKPPLVREKYYRGGFAALSPARGGAYFTGRRGTRVLGGNKVWLVLSGGALARDLAVAGSLSAGNRVKLAPPARLSLSASMGTFRGHTLAPATRQAMAFGGVVLQRQGVGCGCFLGPETSGQVRLSATNDTGYVAQFETLGSTFAPVVEVDSTFLQSFSWAWSDGTTSSDYPGTTKDFGSAQPRQQGLMAYPPGAVVALNLGFDQSDGGDSTPLPLQSPQNVGAVSFPAPLPGLKYWASSYNPITNLDFTGFNSLEVIESYECPNLQHAVLDHLPSLRRACVEICHLQDLDISGDPNLEDLRAAANQFTKIVVGEGTGPKLRHWCTRDNPQLNQHLQDIMKDFYSLQECYLWNAHQSGALSFVSTNLTDVRAWQNAYTSADFSGQPKLTNCELYENRLTQLVLTTCANLEILDVHQNQLPTPVLDQLLALLDTTGTNLTRVDLSQNAGPVSSAGRVHYQNLVNRGVDVRVDF